MRLQALCKSHLSLDANAVCRFRASGLLSEIDVSGKACGSDPSSLVDSTESLVS